MYNSDVTAGDIYPVSNPLYLNDAYYEVSEEEEVFIETKVKHIPVSTKCPIFKFNQIEMKHLLRQFT